MEEENRGGKKGVERRKVVSGAGGGKSSWVGR